MWRTKNSAFLPLGTHHSFMRALSRLALRRGWSPLQATHPGTSLASRHLTTLGEQDVIAPPGTFEQTDLPTTVVCDLGAIENNVRQLRRIVGPDVLLAPALKSNAYGHGAVAVGHAAVKAGVDWIAVASIAEAMQLREAGTCHCYLQSWVQCVTVRDAQVLRCLCSAWASSHRTRCI